MPNEPDFDVEAAHRYFAAECFNRAWDLMEKPGRTVEEDEEMVRLNRASHWHWTQRPDYTRKNASVGYWQASRIYGLLGQADNARRYGLLCLEASLGDDVAPFYLAYAYEALARAESLADNRQQMEDYMRQAKQLAGLVADPEDRKLILDDLGMLAVQPGDQPPPDSSA